jgi:hypothetical protein
MEFIFGTSMEMLKMITSKPISQAKIFIAFQLLKRSQEACWKRLEQLTRPKKLSETN